MKLNLKPGSIPSTVGWIGAVIGASLLLLLGVKWAWNSFFAEVLGFKYIGWGNALALLFLIALVFGLLALLKESGK